MTQDHSGYCYKPRGTDLFNKTANGVLCNVPHWLSQGILYFQNAIRYHATHINVNLFLCIKKSICIPSQIFTNIIDVQQYYIQMSYTKFHPNWTTSVNRIIPSYDFQCTDFDKTYCHLISFCRSFLNRILPRTDKKCESAKFNWQP